ncbi:RelE-like HigB toxin of type II HigAB toxin-antitoxin system [Leptospira meyeri]|uniref:RelE-like HigB toxin of type II HigAB toxin-antitoxin system n=1 Tax=Leptospira meyeri TaxID=29508 RepID=A0A4R8MWH7_LEPME|nr:type II toxin-antitoxin system HigB family toxin [Leptospira meyeri]TDY71316.1 RelE-like HigB toxin of type II HigAB toxin-antitoxin system [Leptospira meyeri]
MEFVNRIHLERKLKEKKFQEHKLTIIGIIESFKVSKVTTSKEIIEIYQLRWRVDYVSPNCYVFDITNKIRMILFIDLENRTFIFYGVFTHDEYDTLNIKKIAKNNSNTNKDKLKDNKDKLKTHENKTKQRREGQKGKH